MNHASLFRMSLVASPKQSLSKICGYRPHKVSQIESLPQTWVIKPTMLARSVYTRKGRDGQWKTVSARSTRARGLRLIGRIRDTDGLRSPTFSKLLVDEAHTARSCRVVDAFDMRVTRHEMCTHSRTGQTASRTVHIESRTAQTDFSDVKLRQRR